MGGKTAVVRREVDQWGYRMSRCAGMIPCQKDLVLPVVPRLTNAPIISADASRGAHRHHQSFRTIVSAEQETRAFPFPYDHPSL